jgi:hypothetical protein
MAARYLKAESANLFVEAELFFEKAISEPAGCMVKEDTALYGIQPARKRLE